LSPFEVEVIFPFALLHGNKASTRNRHEHFDPFVLLVLQTAMLVLQTAMLVLQTAMLVLQTAMLVPFVEEE